MNPILPAFKQQPKKIIFIFLYLSLLTIGVRAQSWMYNFGNSQGIFNTNGSSTSFLPTPASGTAKVRLANDGAFVLDNPGFSLGDKTELQIIGSSTSDINKFSLYGYDPGSSSYMKFTMRFSRVSGGNWFFYCGSGDSFLNDNPIETTEAFTGIKWSFDAYGSITAAAHSNSGMIPFPDQSFIQDNDYTIEIFSNNTYDLQFYNRTGSNTLHGNSADIWINGILVMHDIPKMSLSDLSVIDSWMFYNDNNSGILALDDIIYSNEMVEKIILPVHFYNVKANTNPQGVQLSWENSSEDNLLEYKVEKSTDSRNFSTIGGRKDVLNNGMKTTYSFIDPSAGEVNFYRIKAITTEGKSYNSEIIRINKQVAHANIMIYPNPVNAGNVLVGLENLPKGIYTIKLLDVSLREQLRKTISHTGGSYSELIDLPFLTRGIYHLYISNGTSNYERAVLVN